MKKTILLTALLGLVSYAPNLMAQCNDFSDVARFSPVLEQTITDYKFGLMWSACAISPSTGRCMSDSEVRSRMTGLKALQFADEAVIGGHSDWRLPNLKEAMTLFGGCNDFTYQAPLQIGKYQRRIWTATTDAGQSIPALKTIAMTNGQIVPWRVSSSAASVFLVRDISQGAQ
jgi:hypothetical protein